MNADARRRRSRYSAYLVSRGPGTLTSVQIDVEVGGGAGSIDFPVANVTATSK